MGQGYEWTVEKIAHSPYQQPHLIAAIKGRDIYTMNIFNFTERICLNHYTGERIFIRFSLQCPTYVLMWNIK
jgi:hypothetical protein